MCVILIALIPLCIEQIAEKHMELLLTGLSQETHLHGAHTGASLSWGQVLAGTLWLRHRCVMRCSSDCYSNKASLSHQSKCSATYTSSKRAASGCSVVPSHVMRSTPYAAIVLSLPEMLTVRSGPSVHSRAELFKAVAFMQLKTDCIFSALSGT